ncbi:DUF6942 family protein [Rhodanobacter aciditrophus]|uniref:DUF6942 family protein n=1 Tax=Rhodanobacter aciditrophus TaxID=1623218 RepID=A0ABW4B0P8_9GAMM
MKLIFLLPNKPLLPQGVMNYREMDTKDLISLNGNHWRKILTIIAKLTTFPSEDWRIVRDNKLWDRAKLVFNAQHLASELNESEAKIGAWVFIVGKTFNDDFPIPENAKVLGEAHVAKAEGNLIWSPYLDYRQFPNDLIDEIVQHLRVHTVLC